MRKTILLPILALTVVGCAGDFYYENDKKVEVTKVAEKRDNKSNVTYYKTSNGHKVGVTNEILVQCKADVDCTKVLSKYETLSVSNLSDTILLVTVATEKNVFEVSQTLYNDADIEVAHPNFIKEKVRR
ncbi:MAG: hypothetical protein K0U38_11040 [Epsilonproteobacteria bacterium]|nr:hypothetical protein [Campylobacterota bacterium]